MLQEDAQHFPKQFLTVNHLDKTKYKVLNE